MTSTANRDPVVKANRIKIVEAQGDEEPDYWLISNEREEFPILLNDLHDIMHVLHQLHEQEHHH
jgi:hypothetical protein